MTCDGNRYEREITVPNRNILEIFSDYI